MKELGRSAPSSPFWRMIGSRLNGASQMAIPPKCGGAARPFKSSFALGPAHNECKILEATRSGHADSQRLSCTDLPHERTRTQRAILTALEDDSIETESDKPYGNLAE